MKILQHRIFLLSLLLLSCSLMCEAKVVTSSQAETVANSFFRKSGVMKKSLKLRPVTNRRQAPSQTSATPAYHLFTGDDGKGFVIVSGDDVSLPILGYSTDATVSADGTLPPAMQELLDDLENQIRQAQDDGAEASAEVARQWQAPADAGISVVQLSTALWGQSAPYNQQCPKDNGKPCLTGCVATAYAILMKYYGYPSQGYGVSDAYTTNTSNLQVPSRDLNHAYSWSNMPMEYVSGQYTTAQANSVAQLMADIGAVFKMDYTTNNSTTSVYQPDLFAHFRFNPGKFERRDDYSLSEWLTMLQTELDMEHPVVYRGAPNASEGGHAFLLDGYTNQNYFSVNWGWYGNYNGYFTISALNPGSDNYSSEQQACLDCVPFAQATSATTVAIVDGNTPCPSLETAFGMAQTGKAMSIKLVSDTKVPDWTTITEGKVITLDLNGHALDTYGSITVRGKLTVKDNVGSGKISIVSSNTSIFNNNGELIIEGGTYENKVPSYTDTDYRRCIWTSAGSNTHIKNGSFTAKTQVCCFNGNGTIDDGTFNCIGNSGAVQNYGKESRLVINGGTFSNTADKPSGSDYRRGLWADAGTNTNINGGKFTCNSASQAVCINGNGLINSGSIINKGTGIGLASSGDVKVNYCQVSAPTILRIFNDAKLKCAGGLYSQQVASQFLADDCRCVSNTDAETKSVYPYKVYDPYASPGYQQGKRGDVNGDGKVDVADIANIIDIMAGKDE